MKHNDNRAGYTATSCGQMGRGGNALFDSCSRTDGPTDGPTEKATKNKNDHNDFENINEPSSFCINTNSTSI